MGLGEAPLGAEESGQDNNGLGEPAREPAPPGAAEARALRVFEQRQERAEPRSQAPGKPSRTRTQLPEAQRLRVFERAAPSLRRSRPAPAEPSRRPKDVK